MDEQRILAVEGCGETLHDCNYSQEVAFSSELYVYCRNIRGREKPNIKTEENGCPETRGTASTAR